MKNKNGFTLVELLVVMVILGIVAGMSWPAVRRIQEMNTLNKFDSYGDALISAAKVYVDSYEEDLFYYDEDLKPDSQKNGQCGFISYMDLKEHGLMKDFAVNEITCDTPYTFVLVKRVKGKYTYKYYLGCANKSSLPATGIKWEEAESKEKIVYIFPNKTGNEPYNSEDREDGSPYKEFGCEPPELNLP